MENSTKTFLFFFGTFPQGRQIITRAAQAGEVLRVGQADVQGQLALGSVDHGGVGETHLHLQIISGFVVETIVRVSAPGPGPRIKDHYIGLSNWKAAEAGWICQ